MLDQEWPEPDRDRVPDLTAETIADRWRSTRAALPESVRLLAVSKTMASDRLREAYRAGARDFAENRVQEAVAKQADLLDLSGITWHLIGHLQANKAKKAVACFDWLHSIDSLDLAERVDRHAAELDRQPQVCLQVKLASDPSKFGWAADRLWADLPALDRLSHLDIRGLMVIAPLGWSAAETQALFEQGRDLARSIAAQPWQRLRMDQLSMGMSNDWSLAVAAGATIVRIGRGIFGDRS